MVQFSNDSLRRLPAARNASAAAVTAVIPRIRLSGATAPALTPSRTVLVPPRRQLRPLNLPIRPAVRTATEEEQAYWVRRAVIRRALLGIILVLMGQLVISALTSQAIYQIADLKRQSADMDTQLAIVTAEVDALRSSSNLQNEAHKRGMVASEAPVYLDVEKGKIYGTPKPASGDVVAPDLVGNEFLTQSDN